MAGDNVVEERTGADYEYLSKPRWQRVVIAIAGPAMNVLLAFLIFWGIYGLVGVPFEPDLRQPADVIAVPTTPAIARASSPEIASSPSTAKRRPRGRRSCRG
jgi:membrane-associated protease RseP (regulator of RpoE activity)